MRSSRGRLVGSAAAEVASVTLLINIVEGESTIGLLSVIIGTVLSSLAGESEFCACTLSTVETLLTDVTVSSLNVLILGRE